MIDPKRIWMSSQLPTLPSVAIKLLELTRDPETEIRQVIEVINTDPAIAAKILKAANSSFFGLSSEVRTLDRAVPLLGTTVSTSLALSFSLTDDAMSKGPVAEHYQSYWRQSIVQGAAAELLGMRQNKAIAAEYFLSGLLLDLGRLAMLKTIPRQYLPVLEKATQEGKSLSECESQSLGFNHVEIGSKLMENWKLPKVIIRSVQHHHATIEDLSKLQGETDAAIIKAMAVAATVGDYVCTSLKGAALDRLRQLTADYFQMTPADLEEFLQRVDTRFKQAGSLFKIDMTHICSPSELMTEANEQLSQLAVKEHFANTQAKVRQQTAEAERRALESWNVELQDQAMRDPLTKMYNRHFFDEVLTKEIHRCSRIAAPVGLIFADIDHFKNINDTYGHPVGDEVLQGVAKIMARTLRDSDTLARYGGEEFVIMASQPTEKGLEKLATRIRENVEAEVFEIQGHRLRVTLSLGAAINIPSRLAKDFDKELITAADACMYTSKKSGRNRVTVHSMMADDERRMLILVSQHRFSRWLVSHELIDIPTISKALIECQPSKLRIGELALQYKIMTPEQIQRVLAEQELSPARFGEIACQRRMITEVQLSRLLALQQEDPKELTAILVRQGLMGSSTAEAVLDDYLRSMTPELATA